MSEQALDLRRSLRTVWRHKIIVGIITALGISAGIAFTILRPPLLTSQALVALPTSKYIGTKVFVAGSNPVLINAGRRLDPPLSLQELRGRVQVKNPTPTIVSINAQGKTAAQGRENREHGRWQLHRLPPVREQPRCADAGDGAAARNDCNWNATAPSFYRQWRARRGDWPADRVHLRACNRP